MKIKQFSIGTGKGGSKRYMRTLNEKLDIETLVIKEQV